MAGAVSHWYFFRENEEWRTKIPLVRSVGRVFRYHLGSIFFGSFVIAVIWLIRIILMIIDKYTKNQQKANKLLMLAIKCTQCCMWCLEKTIKFITDYCYIYVAMQGSSFCAACFQTFSLIIGNPAQLAINTFVRTILSLIQKIGLPVAAGWLCNLYLVNIFSSVFACTLDTLFVCCCRDKADYKGKFMPDRLRLVFGFGKKKKDGQPDEDDLVAS